MQTIESSVLRIVIAEKGAKLVHFVSQSSQTDYFKDSASQKMLEVTFTGADQEENWAELLSWTIVDKGDSRISLALIDNNSSYKKFPYHFEVILTYAVEGNRVDTKFYLKNNSHKDMPFSLNFSLPLIKSWSISENANQIDLTKDDAKLSLASTSFNLLAKDDRVTALIDNAVLAGGSSEEFELSLTLN